MTRREILAVAAAAPAAFTPRPALANGPPLKNMGMAPTAVALRAKADRQSFDIVEHCHNLGLGSAQTRLSSHDPETIKKFRQKAESYNMRTILSAPLPKLESEVEAYDAAVKAAKEAGAVAMHAALTGRRYEQYPTLETFKLHFAQCQKMVSLAEPVLRKHQMKLAVENHKGWRAAEQAEWIKRVGSEWVRVCFDFGNNLALCEDPMQTFQILEPFTIYCHMKDMGVANYEDGFLLSEVVFGDGIVDLRPMVDTLQRRDPNMIFALEMITRDPLKIPVYKDSYWPTFSDPLSPLPGRDLARVLDIVRKNPPKTPLPKITGLSPADQVKAEDDYNLKCIEYARKQFRF
jgi:sugar phosphate isomerase/epimerase